MTIRLLLGLILGTLVAYGHCSPQVELRVRSSIVEFPIPAESVTIQAPKETGRPAAVREEPALVVDVAPATVQEDRSRLIRACVPRCK
jgi:hypothetical protein